MSTALWLVVGAVALLALAWKFTGRSLDGNIERAIKDEEVTPLIEAILRKGEASQPDAFNHAIRGLWDAYQRPLAVPVIKALVEHHEDAPIAQYWLEQVQTVEPDLARQTLDSAFLEAHYQPEVAASCGKAG